MDGKRQKRKENEMTFKLKDYGFLIFFQGKIRGNTSFQVSFSLPQKDNDPSATERRDGCKTY